MKLRVLIGTIWVSLFLLGCDDPATNSDLHTVSGIVFSGGTSKKGVAVSVDNAANWVATTDETGYFEIPNISEGSHLLKASITDENEEFSERTYTLEVYDDISLSNLVLPVPVKILLPVLLSGTSIQVIWTASDAIDFREYKLFRHASSGLDESTGTLIHVSTSLTDTLFTDNNLDPLTEYFYRVYVMNEFGRLGGSNIESIETENVNLVINGSFEEIDNESGFPLNWSVWNNAQFLEIDQQFVHDGLASLRADWDAPEFAHHPLFQLIDPSSFVAGDRYKLSYWIKATEMEGNQPAYYTVLRDDNWDWAPWADAVVGPQPASDWRLVEYEFTYPENSSMTNFRLEFYYEGFPAFQVWLDQIALERI